MVAQCPSTQKLKPQHSGVSAHVSPTPRHTHTPSVHSICPQQSLLFMHGRSPPTQHSLIEPPNVVCRHSRPWQHSLRIVQSTRASPGRRHIDTS